MGFFAFFDLVLRYFVFIFSFDFLLICVSDPLLAFCLFLLPFWISFYVRNFHASRFFPVKSLVVVINSKQSDNKMVLDDKASSFLLQVRQAMAASSGSPVSAESIPLEEVAAAVEASGGGFSSVLNEVAAATLSNSVSIFFIVVS
jgi:hypothetical protein